MFCLVDFPTCDPGLLASLTLVSPPVAYALPISSSLGGVGPWPIIAIIGLAAASLSLALYDRLAAARAREHRRQLQTLLAEVTQLREHYRSAVELSPQIPWTTDASGKCLEMGPKWSQFTGRDRDAALGFGWLDVIHADDFEEAKKRWDDAVATGEPFDVNYRIEGRDGTFRWFRDRGQPRRDEVGAIVRWYGSLDDIHHQVVVEKSLKESEERYRLASRATDDLIWDWSNEAGKIDWGGAIGSHLGYHTATEGTSFAWWAERVHPDDRETILASLDLALNGTGVNWTGEYRFQKADGTYIDILSRGHIVRDADGRAIRATGAMMNVSEQKRVEAALRWAAHHDSLTELPNRVLYHIRLDEAVRQAKEGGPGFTLVILDVDHFKHFNDTRGHDAGDELLRWIAGTLKSGLSEGATIARLGGDEFAIIIPNEGDACPDKVSLAIAGARGKYQIGRETVDVSVTAGFACWPRDADDTVGLIKSADLALYAAKSEGRGRVRQFHTDMRDAADKRTVMIEQATAALRDDRISAFFQPKVCLRTGNVVGLEALLRWNHPTLGVRSPGSIAAAFEDVGLSTRITDRMIACVLSDARRWLDQGLDFGNIAINASAADFVTGNFAERLLGKLREFDIPETHIELEVTESVFLGQGSDRTGTILRELSAAGVTIALDDFGTGYASLSHLSAFPVDVLKIDQSFVRKSSTGEDRAADDAIVRAIIGLARNLHIRTVAEGVETPEQACRLMELKCDVAQGYLFSRPVAPSRVPYMIKHANEVWDAVLNQNASTDSHRSGIA